MSASVTLADIARVAASGERDVAISQLRDWFERDASATPASLGEATGLALRLDAAPLALQIAEAFVLAAPAFAGSHHALGLARAKTGDAAGAEAALREALRLAPDAPVVLLHLARHQLENHRTDEAFALYDRCVRLRPDWLDARIGRGLARLRAFRAEEAVADFRWWSEREPDNPSAWRGLAEALELDGQFDACIAARQRELALAPEDPERLREAGLAFARMGMTTLAREALAIPIARDATDMRARWAHWQMLPLCYRDIAEIAKWRAAWTDTLVEFEAIDPHTLPRERIADALLVHTPFFMHYQGGDLTTLQRRYGALVTRWARAWQPHTRHREKPRETGPLRIGFASAYFRNHTVRGLFSSWLRDLDRTRFRVIAIYLGAVEDSGTAALPQIADELIRGHPDNDAWVAALEAADLDVLVWLDIGMDALTQLLASLRFAPVTAMAWGHPVTSGFEAVDWFLSSDAMEPSDGEAHYSEKLHALPGIGIGFSMPGAAVTFKRAPRDPARAVRFVCAQSVFKLLPRNLGAFAELAARLPDAEFHFVPHASPAVRASFEALLRDHFTRVGAEWGTRVHIHPALKHDAFLRLLQHADVFLDTFGWSGGHTTLEALAMDLPIVTMPGAFMRARHTYAMLRALELDDALVARDESQYLDIATRLAEDLAFHTRVVETIAARKARLYDDKRSVRALEEFLARACNRMST